MKDVSLSSYLLCIEFVEVLVEQFPYVLHHGGTCDLYDAGGLWRVCIVESVFYQAALTPIQVLDLLLTYHDFLEREGERWCAEREVKKREKGSRRRRRNEGERKRRRRREEGERKRRRRREEGVEEKRRRRREGGSRKEEEEKGEGRKRKRRKGKEEGRGGEWRRRKSRRVGLHYQ